MPTPAPTVVDVGAPAAVPGRPLALTASGSEGDDGGGPDPFLVAAVLVVAQLVLFGLVRAVARARDATTVRS